MNKLSDIVADIVAVVQVVLILLKLIGLIEWSWWVVFAPILISVIFLLSLIVIAIILGYV